MSESRLRKQPSLSAYEQGVRLLARRDHSVAELRRKLMQRHFPAAEIDDALATLTVRGFLNDERTARLWAEQEARRGGQGRIKALNRMLEHGLSREHAEAALAELWDPALEREHAQAVLQSLIGSIPESERGSQKGWAKLARRLANRGFDQELIRELLRADGGTESE